MSNTECLFSPKSVAIYGRFGAPAETGAVFARNVVEGGFHGIMTLVGEPVSGAFGRPVLSSLDDVEAGVEVLIYTLGIDNFPTHAEQIRRLAPKVVVLGASRHAGGSLPSDVAASVHKLTAAGISILGPSSAGSLSPADGFNGSIFHGAFRRDGTIALCSENAAVCVMILDEMAKRGSGVSRCVSLGEPIGMSHSDVLPSLASDERTAAVGLVIERVTKGPAFMQACSEVVLRKPVVALVLSDEGGEALDIALRQCGVLVAEGVEQFIDLLWTLSAAGRRLPLDDSVALIATSAAAIKLAHRVKSTGGLRIVSADAKLQKRVCRALPPLASADGGLNITPFASPEAASESIQLYLAGTRASGAIVMNIDHDRDDLPAAVVHAALTFAGPMVAFVSAAPRIHAAFQAAGIPVLSSPERAVRAYEALLAYRNLVEVQKRKGIISREKIVARLAKGGSGDGKAPHAGTLRVDALALLSSAGIGVVPHVRVSGLAEALKFVNKVGGPVWMVPEPAKPNAKRPPETAGPLAGKSAVKTAFISLRRKFPGAEVLVRSEISGTCEFAAAGRFDFTFGPMLSLSVASPAGESRTVAKRICPIRKTDAMSMIRELPELARTTGESEAGVVVNALTDALLKLSDLLVNTEGLLELDIRRMVLSGGRLVATEASATMTA